MDHAFRTERAALTAALDGLALAADLTTLLTMTVEDHACLLARREPAMAAVDVRVAALRRAGRLGMLVADIGAAAHTAGVPTPEAAPAEAAWAAFLLARTPPPPTFTAALEELAHALSTRRDALQAAEHDSGSSSYSDYSDSQTESTDEEGAHDTGGSGATDSEDSATDSEDSASGSAEDSA